MTQGSIPCDDVHHDKFKLIAVGQKKSMKSMVHDWIDSGCVIHTTESNESGDSQ